MPAPIRTVRDPKLSAWQSAVQETLRRRAEKEQPAAAAENTPVPTDLLAGDARLLGTTAFALAHAPGTRGAVLTEEGLAIPAATGGPRAMKSVDGAAAPQGLMSAPAAAELPGAPAANQQPAPQTLESAAAQVTESATEADETEVKKQAVLSAHFYDMAESARTGHWIHALALLFKTIFWWGIRKYSTGDLTGWITTVTQYIKTYSFGTRQPMYRDWKTDGGGNSHYSVVEQRLPANATVAIVGDWGTGMPDAIALLRHTLAVHKVDAVLHLGDVYYSGTRGEFRNNVQKVYRKLCPKPESCPPFYQIPGNHCYYSRGPGFYETIDRMNATAPGQPDRHQKASYFCLRTADDAWQFLGMDTGINDRDPLKGNSSPGVRDSELDWHLDKLANFKGSSVLLSHHQLFSSNGKVNPDAQAGQQTPVNVNPNLLQQFGGALGRVVAWFWGHEHNLVIYDPVRTDDGRALPPGRLVGSSAYEETRFEDPYAQKFPSVSFNAVRLTNRKGYFWHGYAIAKLGPTAMEVDYYQFPSSGTDDWEKYQKAPRTDTGFGHLFHETIPAAGQPPIAVEIAQPVAEPAPQG
ncbi:MAG TPA: metallophosphoesterase [Longimicrobium sp.]